MPRSRLRGLPRLRASQSGADESRIVELSGRTARRPWLSGFRGGDDQLDEWLIRHARRATGQGTRTYLLVGTDDSVAGYFAITPHYLRREETPSHIGGRAPRQIPAILLAKLALDQTQQGSGLGSELLAVALATIVDAGGVLEAGWS